jgi:signal peptidase II
VVVAADQVTKTLALDHLKIGQSRHVLGPANLVLTFNSGAAFSVGRGVTPIVEAVVIAIVVWLVAASRKASQMATGPAIVGLGLLLGGALGNLADRVFRHEHGAVVDFIQAVGWWPVFNVADAAIVVGVIVVALTYARRSGG